MRERCRVLARQAGTEAYEQGLNGTHVYFDKDNPKSRPPMTTNLGETNENIRDKDKKIDDLSRDLIDRTNENRLLIEEISGLENGLKEIAEQLKKQRETKGNLSDQRAFVLESPSLDRILQVLETQRVAGRFDNALMMKSEKDILEGRLREIRDELHRTRQEKSKAEFSLRDANEKLFKYQRDLQLFEEAGAVPLRYQTMRIPEGTAASSRDIITALNEYLVDALAEVTAQREMNQQLEEGLEKYRRKLNVIKHQTGLLYKDFHEKQQQWINEQEKNNEVKHDLQTEIEKNLVKLQEFDVKRKQKKN